MWKFNVTLRPIKHPNSPFLVIKVNRLHCKTSPPHRSILEFYNTFLPPLSYFLPSSDPLFMFSHIPFTLVPLFPIHRKYIFFLSLCEVCCLGMTHFPSPQLKKTQCNTIIFNSLGHTYIELFSVRCIV